VIEEIGLSRGSLGELEVRTGTVVVEKLGMVGDAVDGLSKILYRSW